MADRNNIADQNRREAQFWASEWRYKQKKKKIIIAVAAVVCLAVLAAVIHFVSIKATRTTYSSEEEMKAALQGRFKGYYSEDIFIDGDKIRIVYYEKSHYDIEYARKYGYSEYDDSMYDDYVVEWDYRNGRIKCDWMSDLIVDKNGRIQYYSQPFVKTDEPAPEPFDPALLEEQQDEGAGAAAPEEELSEEEQTDIDNQEKSMEETQEAAEAAGVLPEGEGDEI